MNQKELKKDIYDDFKLKKTLVSMVYTKIFQRFTGQGIYIYIIKKKKLQPY